MVSHQINDDGTCSTCQAPVTDKQYFECSSCEKKYHAVCNGTYPYCSKTAVQQFKLLEQKIFFKFVCPHCQTAEENIAASTMKQQIAELVAAVASLVKEVSELKKEKGNNQPPAANSQPAAMNEQGVIPPKPPSNVWGNENRMKKVKTGVTLCIKNDGHDVDIGAVKNIVTSNGIQVNKASVSKKNGDLYIDLPSDESRDQLMPLLNNANIPDNRIVNIKQKCPTISIRNVTEFGDENEFIEKVKAQNKCIKDMIESGSEFSVVFTRKNKQQNGEENEEERYMIVIRVGDDIRDALKAEGDRLFFGFSSYRIMDRVYIKSCAKCHKFGHYHAECTNGECCGYCLAKEHKSDHCPVRAEKDNTKFRCTNCKDANKVHEGHSSHYSKCPTYLEVQKKTMKNIPYYAKNK